MIEVQKTISDRVSQGDVYKNIEFIDSITEENGIIEINKIIFPYVIILTQDCDLAQDFTFRSDDKKSDDKLILSYFPHISSGFQSYLFLLTSNQEYSV